MKEIVDLVMNPARLRLVNTEATAVTDNEMAGDDLNDGCGTQRHDTKVTTSEYDYRTDEVCVLLLKDSTQRNCCCTSSLLLLVPFKY